MDLQMIIGGVVAFGILVAGLGYGYAQFSKGRRDNRKEAVTDELDTLQLLSSKVEALEKLSNDQEKQIVSLNRKIDDLTLAVKERDKKIDEYILILQNRNPRFEDFITKSEKFMEDTSHSINHIKSVTDELKGGMTPKA